jgi:hypothetical protein
MSPPTVKIGCAELPPGMSRTAYFQRLSFLESSALVTSQPAMKALRKWRSERPEDSALSLAVAHTIDLGYLADAVAATGAEVVVFRTPAEISPSSSNRAMLSALLGDKTAALPAVRAWDPQGLWEPGPASALARDAGALRVLDPLATDPLREQVEVLDEALELGEAYLRPSGLGSGRARFRETDLDDLAMRLEAAQRIWVAFANPERLKDARAFVRRLEDAPDEE